MMLRFCGIWKEYRCFTLSCVALIGLCLNGCGSSENRESSHEPQAMGAAPQNSAALAGQVQGAWSVACDPEGASMADSVTFFEGKFERETILYADRCDKEESRVLRSGTYQIGAGVKNLQELKFDEHGFALKAAVDQVAWEIDFFIEEWVIKNAETIDAASITEIENLRAICPSMSLEDENKVLRVSTKDCELPQYSGRSFDIISVQDNKMLLGAYIGNVNSFDSAAGTTLELRSNILLSQQFARVP